MRGRACERMRSVSGRLMTERIVNSGALPWSLPACGLSAEPLRRALLLLPLGERRGSLGMRAMPAPAAPPAAPAPASRPPCAHAQASGQRRFWAPGVGVLPSTAPVAGLRPAPGRRPPCREARGPAEQQRLQAWQAMVMCGCCASVRRLADRLVSPGGATDPLARAREGPRRAGAYRTWR